RGRGPSRSDGRVRVGSQSDRALLDVARQHFALADVVRGAHDALLLHALDDAGGAVVADLQVALDEARRAFALAADQRHRLVVELVAGAFALGGLEARGCGSGILGPVLDIDGPAAAGG